MNKVIVIGIIVLAIIGGVAYTSINKEDEMMDKKIDESAKMENKEEVEENNNDDVMEKEEEMMKTGSYESYSPEKLARAETGDVVLFFHASWCPTCRGLNADIEKNVSMIPQDVSILKVDYDTETELKKKYGITYQHTLVQVNADGSMIKKWSGSPSLSSLVSQIN